MRKRLCVSVNKNRVSEKGMEEIMSVAKQFDFQIVTEGTHCKPNYIYFYTNNSELQHILGVVANYYQHKTCTV